MRVALLGRSVLLIVACALLGCSDNGPSADATTTSRRPRSSVECTETPDTTPVPVVVIDKPIALGTTVAEAIEDEALIIGTIGWASFSDDFFGSFEELGSGAATSDLLANQVAQRAHFGITVYSTASTTAPICPR